MTTPGRWIGAWLAVQLGLVVYGLVGGRWAWDMFADPPSERSVVVASARTATGDWEPLPIDRLFGYRRGFTQRTLLDEVRALHPRGHRLDRAAFARWAVECLAPDAGYVEVELHRQVDPLGFGSPSIEDLGTFPVAE